MTMRFAAIADVHGNHLALDAVITDIRAQGISDIVNLYYYIWKEAGGDVRSASSMRTPRIIQNAN